MAESQKVEQPEQVFNMCDALQQSSDAHGQAFEENPTEFKRHFADTLRWMGNEADAARWESVLSWFGHDGQVPSEDTSDGPASPPQAVSESTRHHILMLKRSSGWLHA